MTNKIPGRIGDTPIVGHGIYANIETCAISATGTGEQIMKMNLAFDISSVIKYKGLSIKDASNYVLRGKKINFLKNRSEL